MVGLEGEPAGSGQEDDGQGRQAQDDAVAARFAGRGSCRFFGGFGRQLLGASLRCGGSAAARRGIVAARGGSAAARRGIGVRREGTTSLRLDSRVRRGGLGLGGEVRPRRRLDHVDGRRRRRLRGAGFPGDRGAARAGDGGRWRVRAMAGIRSEGSQRLTVTGWTADSFQPSGVRVTVAWKRLRLTVCACRRRSRRAACGRRRPGP